MPRDAHHLLFKGLVPDTPTVDTREIRVGGVCKGVRFLVEDERCVVSRLSRLMRFEVNEEGEDKEWG